MSATIPVAGSNARPTGFPTPEAKVLLLPAGVNLKIVPLLKSASNRLPELSKARPSGKLSPDAKVLLIPAGVNLKIVPLLSVATKLPARSEARHTGTLSTGD